MNIDYGNALIKFREELGLTRKEFYEKVGISKHRLSQLENNKNKNSEQTIKSILNYFNVPFYDFLIVYGGYKIDGRTFDSLEELNQYKKERENDLHFIEQYGMTEKEALEEQDLQDYIDMLEYIQTEATPEELHTIINLVKSWQFKKYYKSEFLEYLHEKSKNSTPE